MAEAIGRKAGPFLPKFFAALLAAAALAACAAPQTSVREGISPKGLLNEGDRLFAKGVYSSALMKYSSYLYSPFPDKERLPYARYRVGVCHYFLDQHADAVETLTVLLRDYPGSAEADGAREIIAKCETALAGRTQQAADAAKDRHQRIHAMELGLQSEPDNAAIHYDLANLYWDNGEFSKAVDHYERAIELNRAYEEDGTLRNRVRVTGEGEFTVRDPLLEQKADAIRVRNTSRDVIRRENWLGSREGIRIGGEVENAGLRDAGNVRVEVALYDFFENVIGAQMADIGYLRAGESRPFAVLFFDLGDSGQNIHKYTTRVIHSRP